MSEKRVLVTGASSGIGRACVEVLACRGAHVVAAARDVGMLDTLAIETGCNTLSLDLAGDERTINAALERFERFGGLVNCAGVMSLKPMLRVSVSGAMGRLGFRLPVNPAGEPLPIWVLHPLPDDLFVG